MAKTETNAATINILIADDHPIIRAGLQSILFTQSDFKVLGQAENGPDVLTLIEELKPDIVILDLEMPGLNGVEVVKQLSQEGSETKVIIFTAYDSNERILSAVKAGAKGYLLKGATPEEIVNAVRTVYKGGSSLHSDVASKIMKKMSEDYNQLTPRELEIIHLLGKGMTNRDIANKLYISERTVKFHLSSVFSKLDVENRTEAVTKALQEGLISI